MNNQFDMVEIRDFTLSDNAKCLCGHTHAEHSVRPTPTAIGKCSVCECLTFMLDDQVIDDKVAAETARCERIVEAHISYHVPGIKSATDAMLEQIISEIRGAE